jgi:hypothetical protein
MKNLVQELMLEHPTGWLAILEGDLKVHVVRDGSLASLMYDPAESPMRDPLVQQCHGMVVDVDRRRVVAWPYNKFWNHGEAGAETIDWATARVQEKLDGSLMLAYSVDGDWRVASSGHPTAGGPFGARSYTFRDAFWQVSLDLGVSVSYLDPAVTYMLELCHAPNRIVVRHERPRLVLHGARDLVSGRELPRVELEASAGAARCEVVREFSISSIADCLAAAEALDPLQQEGFVVVDAGFHRVKVKCPRYVILHHMKGEATPRRAVELWQTGETSELLTYFPEMADLITPIQDQLDGVAAQAVRDFYENRARPSRKDFALSIKDRPWAPVLFRMLDHDAPTVDDAKEIMRRQNAAALQRMLGLRA